MDKQAGPSGRVGGDFSFEVMEAFRNAYAQQLATPDEDTIANNSGLPTNTISNTSPWVDHVGLWRYPSGKGPDQDLKAPFNPNSYLPEEVMEEDGEEELSEEEIQELLYGASEEE
jgi:hypothetical protein